MNSLSFVLEENFNYKIYIPIIKDRKRIKDKCLIICCQNLSNALGRKHTNILKNRIKIINYPKQEN